MVFSASLGSYYIEEELCHRLQIQAPLIDRFLRRCQADYFRRLQLSLSRDVSWRSYNLPAERQQPQIDCDSLP